MLNEKMFCVTETYFVKLITKNIKKLINKGIYWKYISNLATSMILNLRTISMMSLVILFI